MTDKRLCIVDYGIGNLRSVQKALAAAGAEAFLSSDPAEILKAQKVVLPGVGAFGDGMNGLRGRGLIEPLQQAVQNQVPLLGICLGMQLLFESSAESPEIPGLGLLPGQVRRFSGELFSSAQPGGTATSGLKIPQTGWNQLERIKESILLAGVEPGSYAYFNHSYYCDPASQNDWLASTEYGSIHFASVVGRGNLLGVQFHPEKSQALGLRILQNFVERL